MNSVKVLFATLLMAFSAATLAAPLTFEIGNHSDGAMYDGSTNPYGVRVDDMGHTFTVGDNLPGAFSGASLSLTFDPANLAAGAVLVGVIINNDTGGAWDVIYTLSDLTAAPNGGFIAQTGVGTLTEQAGEGSFTLMGKTNGTGAFIFDNDGHRLGGNSGWVGRGWVAGSGQSNDFLVTASSPVPLPAAFWLMGTGLLGLFGAGRKR